MVACGNDIDALYTAVLLRSSVDQDALVWLCLGAVSGFMAVGKVLIPQ